MNQERNRPAARLRAGRSKLIKQNEPAWLLDEHVFEISLRKLVSQMSASEIIAELPKLSRTERRQLAVAIFKLEENADLLSDCDRRADERFRLLDMMEEEDARTSVR